MIEANLSVSRSHPQFVDFVGSVSLCTTHLLPRRWSWSSNCWMPSYISWSQNLSFPLHSQQPSLAPHILHLKKAHKLNSDTPPATIQLDYRHRHSTSILRSTWISFFVWKSFNQDIFQSQKQASCPLFRLTIQPTCLWLPMPASFGQLLTWDHLIYGSEAGITSSI